MFGVKNLQLAHDLPKFVNHSMMFAFHKDFIFANPCSAKFHDNKTLMKFYEFTVCISCSLTYTIE